MLSLGSLGGGVRYAYTGRLGGFSGAPFSELNLSLDVGDEAELVARNRQLLLDRLDVAEAVWLRAQHESAVSIVDDAFVGVAAEVDATVTTRAGLGLGSLSADCVLIVLADPVAGVIATAHCGRPGLLAGVVDATVGAMRQRGAGAIRAALGPSICGWCYEVPQAMADEVVAIVPAAQARSRVGTSALDVAAGVLSQLAAHDVEVVRRVGGCTREDPALFSYRRDAVTGRQGALVWRTA